MCLLITGSSNAIRTQLLQTPGLIEDIYGHNEDGLGVMYVTAKQQVKVVKRLPKGAQGFREMIAAMPDDDRRVAVHARMKTHGDIDLTNCHPYQINDASWLMHNGILDTGNAADVSKSDSWHFIADYMQGMGPDVLHNPGYLKMLGEFIGNNRFAIMSADGRLSVVNKDQGVEHDGVWFSNTYAWSPHLLIPTYKPRAVYGNYGRRGGWGGHLGDFDTWGSMDKGSDKDWLKDPEAYDEADTTEAYVEEMVEECLYQYDSTTMGELLEEFPDETLAYLVASYRITQYIRYDPTEYPHSYAEAVQAWIDGEVGRLSRMDPVVVAEALIQCCDVDARQPALT